MYLDEVVEKLISEFELHGYPRHQVRPQAMLLLKHQIRAIVKRYGAELLKDFKHN